MQDKRVTRGLRAWGTAVAMLGLLAGCAKAPPLADEAESMEGSDAPKEASRDGVSAAPRAGEGEDEEPTSEAEVKDEAKGEEQIVAAPVELDAGHDDGGELAIDAGSETAPDASREPVADAALAADAGADADADLTTCENVSIRSRLDVEKHRHCAEIVGDLRISSVGLSAVTADDFPILTTITGDLVISGPQTVDGPHLESVTLGSLLVVEGAVIVLGVAVPEFGGSGPLKELHLPALERIGGHDALGLAVYQASLRALELPALTTIEGTVLLDTLFELCGVNLSRIEEIGGDVVVRYVPRLSAMQLEPLRAAAGGSVRESLLGCCESEDSVSCEGFTDRARAWYCTGCR